MHDTSDIDMHNKQSRQHITGVWCTLTNCSHFRNCCFAVHWQAVSIIYKYLLTLQTNTHKSTHISRVRTPENLKCDTKIKS